MPNKKAKQKKWDKARRQKENKQRKRDKKQRQQTLRHKSCGDLEVEQKTKTQTGAWW